MKFGLMYANAGPFAEPENAIGIAQLAEELGFESVWTVEHTAMPTGYQSEYPYSPDGKMPGGETVPLPDPLIWLAYVGAVTKTLRLATGILILPQRNPVTLAKELATLDRLDRRSRRARHRCRVVARRVRRARRSVGTARRAHRGVRRRAAPAVARARDRLRRRVHEVRADQLVSEARVGERPEHPRRRAHRGRGATCGTHRRRLLPRRRRRRPRRVARRDAQVRGRRRPQRRQRSRSPRSPDSTSTR